MEIVSVDADHPDARALLRAYLADIVGRYHGRSARPDEVESEVAAAEEPLAALLLLRLDGAAAGCVGIRAVGDGVGELTRLFVVPSARGRGAGRRLLAAAEDRGRELALHTLRLDTRADLIEARTLYASAGWHEIPAFNSGPFHDPWFAKRL